MASEAKSEATVFKSLVSLSLSALVLSFPVISVVRVLLKLFGELWSTLLLLLLTCPCCLAGLTS